MGNKGEGQVIAPTIFVVFGATGTLTQKKILPALLDLEVKKRLPKKFRIVGVSNKKHTGASFQAFVRKTTDYAQYHHTQRELASFSKNTSYHCGDVNDPNTFTDLAEKLIAHDTELGACTNKLFYFATPPNLFETTAYNLASSGLTRSASETAGWTRVLFEQPFETNFESARNLEKILGTLFKEKQIFKIDHSLQKESIEMLLAFRFTNPLFEPLWNRKYISDIHITLSEKSGVEKRSMLFDQLGALRDVGEHHVLQMLAILAMDNPGSMHADAIRKQRAKVLGDLRPIRKNEIDSRTIRGQYKGFRSLPGVSDRSSTETFFWIKAYLKTPRWKGVPFYLKSGKCLRTTESGITVRFTNPLPCLCRGKKQHTHYNVLTLRIEPKKGISLSCWYKKPGFPYDVEEQQLTADFPIFDSFGLTDEYEKLLYDALRGDQTRFASSEEMEASWKFIHPILKNWKQTKLYGYSKGSKGPISHITPYD